jgi:hypothetical protein
MPGSDLARIQDGALAALQASYRVLQGLTGGIQLPRCSWALWAPLALLLAQHPREQFQRIGGLGELWVRRELLGQGELDPAAKGPLLPKPKPQLS